MREAETFSVGGIIDAGGVGEIGFEFLEEFSGFGDFALAELGGGDPVDGDRGAGFVLAEFRLNAGKDFEGFVPLIGFKEDIAVTFEILPRRFGIGIVHGLGVVFDGLLTEAEIEGEGGAGDLDLEGNIWGGTPGESAEEVDGVGPLDLVGVDLCDEGFVEKAEGVLDGAGFASLSDDLLHVGKGDVV